MSPVLFNIAIDWVLRRTVKDQRRGIRWTIKQGTANENAASIRRICKRSNQPKIQMTQISARLIRLRRSL